MFGLFLRHSNSETGKLNLNSAKHTFTLRLKEKDVSAADQIRDLSIPSAFATLSTYDHPKISEKTTVTHGPDTLHPGVLPHG